MTITVTDVHTDVPAGRQATAQTPSGAQDQPASHGPRVTRDQVSDLGRLRRTVRDRHIAGVAGGLARHLDVDPIIVRVAFVVAAFFGGAGAAPRPPPRAPAPAAGTSGQFPSVIAVIGFTSSIAAFGPFLVGAALSLWSPRAFFIGCAVYFAACTFLTWQQYARPGAPKPG